jgi:O-antigen ligase
MNLVKFLFIGAILTLTLGEFGKFPFGTSGGISITDILLSFSILFFIIWHAVTKDKIFFPKLFKWILAFWVIALISLIWSLTLFTPATVLKDSLYLIRFMIYSSSLLIVFNLIKSKTLTINGLGNTFLISGLIVIFLGFLQLIFFPNFETPFFALTDFGYDPHQGRLTSTFLDPNYTGAFLTFIAGLIVYRLSEVNNKRNWLFFLTVTILSIILTFSRSAYLMFAVSAIFWGMFNWRKISPKQKVFGIGLGLISLLLISLLVPRFLQRVNGGLNIDDSASTRFSSWGKGIEITLAYPFSGVGFNNIRAAMEKLNLVNVNSMDGGHGGAGIDSSFLTVMVTTGLIGLFIYLIFWVKAVAALYQKNNFLSLVFLSLMIGLFIDSQFINSLFFPAIMTFYFSLLGATLKN